MSPYRAPPKPSPSPSLDPESKASAVGSARQALAARWCRAVPSLRETALRVAYMRSEIARLPPHRVAMALDELCGRAEQADPVAREVLASVTPLFVDVPQVSALRVVAE